LTGNSVQERIDPVTKQLVIQFSYEPELPVIDEFTKLHFSVHDLDSGDHLRNATARVVVTTPGGERLFIFENVTVSEGHFGVEYNFPDDGTHVVLVRIEFDETFAIVSFAVFVPHQSAPSLLNPFPEKVGQEGEDASVLASKIILVSAPAAAAIAIVFVIRKGRLKNAKAR
jgi:hypothetical protein